MPLFSTNWSFRHDKIRKQEKENVMKAYSKFIILCLLATSLLNVKAKAITPAELNSLAKKTHTSLELKVLKSYSEMEYSLINHALRTKDRQRLKESRASICTLDKLMAIQPKLKDNFLLYRGHYYVAQGGEKIGHEFNAETFVSTSLSKSVALKFAETGEGTEASVLDIIEVDPAFVKHLWIAPYSSFKHEQEVLLDRNLRFKVVDIKKTKHPKSKTLLFVRTLNVVDAKRNEMVDKILNCSK